MLSTNADTACITFEVKISQNANVYLTTEHNKPTQSNC